MIPSSVETAIECLSLDIADAVMGNPTIEAVFGSDNPEADGFKADIQIEAARVLRTSAQEAFAAARPAEPVAWRWRSTKGGWGGDWQVTTNQREVEHMMPSHYEVHPLYAALEAAFAARPAEPVAVTPARADDATADQWRDLALQFDGHRIEAMALLRYVSEARNSFEAMGRIGEIKPFLAKPPLSGEAVLSARLSALVSTPAPGLVEALRQVAHDLLAIQTDPRFPSSERVKNSVIRQVDEALASITETGGAK